MLLYNFYLQFNFLLEESIKLFFKINRFC